MPSQGPEDNRWQPEKKLDIPGGASSITVKFAISLIYKLLKGPIDLLTKFLFKDAYNISTLHRSHRQHEGLWRRNLDERMDYHVNWSKLFLGKEQTSCTLWLKSKQGKEFRRITFCIEASLPNLRYQSVVTVIDVTECPCVVAIPGIPLRELEVDGSILREPYGSVSVEILEMSDPTGSKIDLHYRIRDVTWPVDNLEAVLGLRQSNVYRWGKWWNLDFLESEKNELRIRLHGLALHAKFNGWKSRHFWAFVSWLGEIKWFLACDFWIKNIIAARHLRSALRDYLNEF